MERIKTVDHRSLLHRVDKRPLIAQNGGILITDANINAISRIGSPASRLLASFLIDRTMPTMGVLPVRRDQPKWNLRPNLEDDNGSRTSINSTYFEINYQNGDDPRQIEERGELLNKHLSRDAQLVANWDEVKKVISGLKSHDQKRIYLTLFQIFTNDSAALNYAVKLANTHGANITPVTDRSLDIATTYYSLLQGKPLGNIFSEIGNIFSDGTGLFGQVAGFFSENFPNVDYVRSRREADDIRVLGAAKSFMNDPIGRSKPYVVIPLLGGYDIAPALISLGYPREKIAFIIAHKKEISEKERGTKEHPVMMKEIDHNNSGVVLFDDSISEGKHTRDILRQLTDLNIKVKAIRTVFRGKAKEIPVEDVIKHLGVETITYYEPEYVGDRNDSSTATRQRAATVEMVRRNSSVA